MKKRIALTALIVATVLGTTGCGDKMIELTQEEKNQIVQFSAHIIGEFNKNQTEGYVALNKKQLDKIKHPEKYENKTEQTQQPTVEPDSPSQGTTNPDNQENNSIPVGAISFTDLVGIPGLEVTYKGFDICKDYMESDVFSMTADEGNKYVVVSVELLNSTGKDVSVDLLSKNLSLYLITDDKQVKASTTLLPNDFTTYEGKVKADKKIKTVLIFEVSKNIADELRKLEIRAENGGSMSTIITN